MQITHADSFHNYALIIPECGITQHEKERPDVCWSLYQLKDYLNMWRILSIFLGYCLFKKIAPTFPQHEKEIPVVCGSLYQLKDYVTILSIFGNIIYKKKKETTRLNM